jgi:hypothetical protein
MGKSKSNISPRCQGVLAALDTLDHFSAIYRQKIHEQDITGWPNNEQIDLAGADLHSPARQLCNAILATHGEPNGVTQMSLAKGAAEFGRAMGIKVVDADDTASPRPELIQLSAAPAMTAPRSPASRTASPQETADAWGKAMGNAPAAAGSANDMFGKAMMNAK